MTPEEQRITIAESVGWKHLMGDWVAPDATSLRIKRTASDCDTYIYPPDYLNDLNAMHEVEKTLSLDNRHTYYNYLWHICDREHRMASVPGWLVPTATAAQRAEAYLKTVGKWRDS